VTDLDALDGVVAEATRRLGGLDGLVAVAGRTMAGSIVSGTPERWRALFELNLLAPLAAVHHAVGHFPDRGRRDVVLVGSAGAITPLPGVGIYGASKRGLRAAFDSLRLELAPLGVNAGLVMPGMFETEGLTLDGLEIDGEVPLTTSPSCRAPVPPTWCWATPSFMIGLPEGVSINELVARPTGQIIPEHPGPERR
jgi:NAD(P)-dependent dehydrogenase (short-subunit alcohol dehydrogenase family)